MPKSEVFIANSNTFGSKRVNIIYPVENSNTYGYNYYGSSQQITFSIGSANSAWIPGETQLEFSLASGTTASILSGSVDAVFDSVRILNQQGTILLEDQCANIFSRIQQLATITTHTANTCWEENLEYLMSDTASITVAAQKYSMSFRQPFFHENSSIPLPITGELRLVLTLARDSQCMNHPASDAVTYALTQPRLLCPMIAYEQKFLDLLRKVADKGGVLLCHVQNYYQGTTADNAGDNVLDIKFGAKNVLGIMYVNRIRANDSLSTYVEKLGRYQAPTDLVETYCMTGSEKFPSCGVDNYARAYVELKKHVNLYADNDAGNKLTRALYEYSSGTNAATLASTCAKYIGGFSFCSAYQTGIDTQNGGVQLHQNFGSANSGFAVDAFVQYQSVFLIKNPLQTYTLHKTV
jgi:hypothetical protein